MKGWLEKYNLANVNLFIEVFDKKRREYYPNQINIVKHVVRIPGLSMTFVLNKALRISNEELYGREFHEFRDLMNL